jgi:hypothetical protein
LLDILENNTLFFQAFIPCGNDSKLECYGTESDVYIENIIIENSEILYLTVYTYDNPCIPFCNKLAQVYGLNIQNVYYNNVLDFSGKWQIYSNQIIFNEGWNYIQGLYFTNNDLFWETVQESDLNDLCELTGQDINDLRQEMVMKKMDNMSF